MILYYFYWRVIGRVGEYFLENILFGCDVLGGISYESRFERGKSWGKISYFK